MTRGSVYFIRGTIGLFFFLVAASLWLREGMSTPVDEIKILARYCRNTINSQRQHFYKHGQYASLELLEHELITMERRFKYSRPDGYIVNLSTNGAHYALRLCPDRAGSQGKVRYLSAFADETGVIRFASGGKLADATSPVVPSRYEP
jgi:hypothetical protein